MVFIFCKDEFSKKIKNFCDFDPITLEKMDMMNSYFDLVDYKASEYSFLVLYMWQHYYNTHVLEKDGTMYVFGKDDKGYFSIVPISVKKRWERDLKCLEAIFNDCFNEKIVIRAAPKEYTEFIEEDYPGRFEIIADRDSYDYLYDGDKLRSLSGRKLHSKKNSYNNFVKTYKGRYQYTSLNTKEQFKEAYDLMEKWAKSKDVIDETMEIENKAVKAVFDHFDVHRNIKVGGIYIDNQLKAFTLADMLTDDTVCIHIEKASDASIKGLYAAINKLFLENEFPDVPYVNRQDDMGLEGLRKAKKSYRPIEMIEKYTLIEK